MRLFALTLVLFGLVGCPKDQLQVGIDTPASGGVQGPVGGTGGTAVDGGTVVGSDAATGGVAGTMASGGAVGEGGTAATGGASGEGGVATTGGITGEGARTAGGTTGEGGSVTGEGGSVTGEGGSPTGGSTSVGGSVGTGAMISTSGYDGAAGATGGSSGNVVTFSQGKAVGAMTGFGWVAQGAATSLSSPTCAGVPLTADKPCSTDFTWSSESALCVSGTIPRLTGTMPDFGTNWGVMIGVNAGLLELGSGTLPPLSRSFSNVNFHFSGRVVPATGVIRGWIHVSGEPDGVSYCANIISGAPIALMSFSTECWGGSPTSLLLEPEKIPLIDKIGVQIVSDMASSYIISNVCLNEIVFQ
jgi:hypothetical protein